MSREASDTDAPAAEAPVPAAAAKPAVAERAALLKKRPYVMLTDLADLWMDTVVSQLLPEDEKNDAILADAAPAPAGAAPPPADEAADAPPPPPPADDLAAKLQKRAEAIAEIRARARQNTAAARERAEAAKREDAPAAEEGA